MIGFCSVQSLNIVEYVQSPEDEINGSVRYTTSEEEQELIQQENEHKEHQQKAKYYNQMKAALKLCYESENSNKHVSHFFNDRNTRGKYIYYSKCGKTFIKSNIYRQKKPCLHVKMYEGKNATSSSMPLIVLIENCKKTADLVFNIQFYCVHYLYLM